MPTSEDGSPPRSPGPGPREPATESPRDKERDHREDRGADGDGEDRPRDDSQNGGHAGGPRDGENRGRRGNRPDRSRDDRDREGSRRHGGDREKSRSNDADHEDPRRDKEDREDRRRDEGDREDRRRDEGDREDRRRDEGDREERRRDEGDREERRSDEGDREVRRRDEGRRDDGGDIPRRGMGRDHHHLKFRQQRRRGSPSHSRSRSRPRHSRRESSRSPPMAHGREGRTKRSRDEEEYLRSRKRGKEEDLRREHQHQSRSRASRTVLIAQLGMDVSDRTVYLLMSKMAGKVRDVQIIRDGRSQRSKGIAYVEFEEQESAMKALGIEPTSLWTKLGHGANIQPSQAEKNLNSTQAVLNPSGERVNECRLYVGGSANLVADLSEDDLRALFQPFGPLDFVDRHPRNQGEGGTYAFVQYGDSDHARSALKGLSGMMIGGKELKVGMATSAASAGLASSVVVGPNTDLDLVEDNEEGPSTHTGLLKDNLSRARLMRAMVREPISEGSSLLMKSASRLPASNLASAASGAATGTGSRVLILRNLWAAGDQLMHEGGPEKFFKEITNDVKSEAVRFGTIVGCWLDEASENGDCWLRFTTGSAAAKCALGLNRRWFAGRQLVAVVVSEDKWDTGL
ncbi:RNA-binding protein rsd1, putative [Perkinsus marinus ATCC 50983]|uniref:RNA-binding protein rsd1, putative n=1 Tax=Perkinsus marinus (strain ATCC 50983 / TXsc) TaxID=423536 RepID=C5M0S2_PERM5|nr:RNA-binding protein rsd1, putative [Perkinsus marinus ATCC 50983]EEQ97430.1 RNA-binding protein rsd1, putative [Perkinsus marinus ATCC 50983]|eukprot:XP_002764713.1 RNA-binding protein rsd1, putative [Perkinsus marinus ATCC 50983]